MRFFLVALVITGVLPLCGCTSDRSAARPGETIARLTTDWQGRVDTVTIIKSSGSAILDRGTVDQIKKNWHGPPFAEKTVAFRYQLH